MVRLLIDTNVLVSDALWCSLLTVRELAGSREGAAIELCTTTEALDELRYVVKRVFGRRPPPVLAGVVRHRRATATVLDTAELPSALKAERRSFVRDPDDAFLDTACRGFGLDMLVTNDVQAFGQMTDEERGYRISNAESCLLELWSQLVARTGPPTEVVGARSPGSPTASDFVTIWERTYREYCEEISLEPEDRPIFDQLRRARAGRFASSLKAQSQNLSTRRR